MKSRQPRTGGPPGGGIRTRHVARSRAPALRALVGVAAGGEAGEGLGREARGPRTAAGKVAPPATVWRGIENRLELRRLGRARPCAGWRGRVAACSSRWWASSRCVRRHRATTQLASIARPTPQTIYWRVEVLGENQELRARASGARPARGQVARTLGAAGRRHAGVTGPHAATGDQKRVLNAAQRAALAGSSRSPSAWSRGRFDHRAPDRPGAARRRLCAGLILREPPSGRCETVLNPGLTGTPL